MKPSVETGLASHSPIMVAPREFARGSEDGDGWIEVSSKKNLRKQKKFLKKKPSKDISFFSAENNQDEVSSASDSNKSDTSGSSWASILKRSLKMDVPRVSIDIASTSTDSKNSEDLKNEVKYLKTVCTYEEKMRLTHLRYNNLHKSSQFEKVMKHPLLTHSLMRMRVLQAKRYINLVPYNKKSQRMIKVRHSLGKIKTTI